MKKNALIAVLLMIILGLALNTFFSWLQPTENDRIVEEIYKQKTDTIQIEKVITKDNLVYIKYKPNEGLMVQNNVTKHYNSYVKDTLAPALKIATHKIAELQRVNAVLEGKIKAQKTEIDEHKTKTVYYQDKYFSAITKTDTLGNSILNYKYNAHLDIVTEMRNKGLFNGKERLVYVTSPDKNLKINGVEHFIHRIEIKPKRIGIGLQGGYYYAPELNRFYPAFGFGISYNLLNF